VLDVFARRRVTQNDSSNEATASSFSEQLRRKKLAGPFWIFPPPERKIII